MPHAALFGLSVFMALLFQLLSLLFAFIETGAGEPLSRNLLSLSGEAACAACWLMEGAAGSSRAPRAAGTPEHCPWSACQSLVPCLNACPLPPTRCPALQPATTSSSAAWSSLSCPWSPWR